MKSSRWLSVALSLVLASLPITADAQCCYQYPNATFTVSQTSFASYTMNASGSSDPDGQIVSYIWDFGDGHTATTSSPTITHSFDAENPYVTLTVVDNHNLCDTYTRQVQTCGGYNQPHCIQ